MDFPKIDVSQTAPSNCDAVVLGFFQSDEKGKAKSDSPQFAGKSDKDVEALLNRLGESKHFSAKRGEVDLLRYLSFSSFPSVLLLGLGSKGKFELETLRRVGASVYQAQKKAGLENLALRGESVFVSDLPEADALQAFAEGYLLASYQYNEFKKVEKPSKALKLVIVGIKSAGAKQALSKAQTLAEAVCFSRSLGDKPGNLLTPSELARLVVEMAKSRKLKTTVLNRAQIEKAKMGLLMGVAKGSEEEPRFVIVEYRGGKKGDKPIALVGKGVTFDSGGISIKPSAAMEEMKYDMMGAGTVAGIMQAIADLKLPINVTAYIAAVENMPSGSAQKPGDIRTSSKGKTVEIINTDAEGRLILADALEYAQTEDPQAIFDFATLTGAVLVALGNVATGIMGNSPELIDRLKKSAVVSGEKVWELPLFEEYEDDMKSAYADYRNAGSRDAGSSKGGTFLKFFVDSKMPWVHCDIAGTAWHRRDVNYHPPKHASGAMVRLMTHLLENWKTLNK